MLVSKTPCDPMQTLVDPTQTLVNPMRDSLRTSGIYFAVGTFALALRWLGRFHIVSFVLVRIAYPMGLRSLVKYGLYGRWGLI